MSEITARLRGGFDYVPYSKRYVGMFEAPGFEPFELRLTRNQMNALRNKGSQPVIQGHYYKQTRQARFNVDSRDIFGTSATLSRAQPSAGPCTYAGGQGSLGTSYTWYTGTGGENVYLGVQYDSTVDFWRCTPSKAPTITQDGQLVLWHPSRSSPLAPPIETVYNLTYNEDKGWYEMST